VQLAADDRGGPLRPLADDRVGERVAVDVGAVRAGVAGRVLVRGQADVVAGGGVVDGVNRDRDGGGAGRVDCAVVDLELEAVAPIEVR
jgi:hypothetical protein